MKNPKISVVIPVYNGSQTLKKCLESVLDQTYSYYEVIVVNNNSTDDTEDIIKEFCARSERIKYVFEEYKSRGAARNAGINVATGEIIAMTDADCIVPKDWIEQIIRPIVDENEDVVMGSEGDLIGNYWTRNIQEANKRFIVRNSEGKYISHLDTKNFAIKASVMKEMMFDPYVGNMEDFDLFLRLRKRLKIRFVPIIRVEHIHRDSFIKTAKICCDRGYWVAKIFIKQGCAVEDHPMVESLSVKNFILFPFWMMVQFARRPLGEAFFLFVSESSWRLGIVGAILREGRQ